VEEVTEDVVKITKELPWDMEPDVIELLKISW
jgi:hypothetical protein